ncbi:MAG: ATP-dependent sacrificial sulfur transferase LarE [Candidatus Rifleibacteriota bacterium]
MQKLKELLLEKGRVCIAFSGGMDSSFLALVAKQAIPERYETIMVNSAFMAESEMNIARATAQKYGLKFREIRIDILQEPLVTDNSKERCYHCKKAIFKRLLEISEGAILCEGSVTDDDNDYRPGKKALAELRIVSPLRDCGFSKKMVAEGLEKLGAHELVRSAQSCLATRIVTDQKITLSALQQIEQGEKILRETGLDYFRLRHHGEVARIETSPQNLHEALDRILTVSDDLKKLGFKHIALDVEGYRKGSMNRS